MDKKELIEKMIADVMEHFDFDKVRKVMLWLDGEKEVPSTYQLIKKAEELLRLVATFDDEEPRICSTDGFTAEMFDGVLSLSFVLEETSIDDDDLVSNKAQKGE